MVTVIYPQIYYNKICSPPSKVLQLTAWTSISCSLNSLIRQKYLLFELLISVYTKNKTELNNSFWTTASCSACLQNISYSFLSTLSTKSMQRQSSIFLPFWLHCHPCFNSLAILLCSLASPLSPPQINEYLAQLVCPTSFSIFVISPGSFVSRRHTTSAFHVYLNTYWIIKTPIDYWMPRTNEFNRVIKHLQ